jgi:hypothetical protein
MADPLKTTVAIVANPQALQDVRAHFRRGGIATAEIEVSTMRVERDLEQEDAPAVAFSTRPLVLASAAGGALGALGVAGWMEVSTALQVGLGGIGGAVVALALATFVVWVQSRPVLRTVKQRRDFWKVRVGGDAGLIGKARGLASRSGATLRALDPRAVEVPPSRKP